MNEISDPLGSQLLHIDIRTLLKLNSLGADCVAVFMFYIQCSKIQDTSKVWVTKSFVKNGIKGLSKERIQDVNKILEENGMISREQKFGGRGNIGKLYIKLNFLILNTPAVLSADDNTEADNTADDNTATNAYQENLNAYQENLNASQENKIHMDADFERLWLKFPHQGQSKEQTFKGRKLNLAISSNLARNDKPIEREPIREPIRETNRTNDQEFGSVWQLYPRKVAKQKAFEEWKKISLDLYPVIINAIKKQTPELIKKEMKYIPHLSTWIHQKRWEDELSSEGPLKTISEYSSEFQELGASGFKEKYGKELYRTTLDFINQSS